MSFALPAAYDLAVALSRNVVEGSGADIRLPG